VSIDMSMLVKQMEMTMQMIQPLLVSLGLNMKLDRIDIEPKDCPDKCIDFVWRFECEDPEVCRILKEKIMEEYGGKRG